MKRIEEKEEGIKRKVKRWKESKEGKMMENKWERKTLLRRRGKEV
jgi:hypothetical protein